MQNLLHLGGQLFQHSKLWADDAEFDGGVDGGAVLEKDQLDPGTADGVKLFAQPVDHPVAFFAAPLVHDGQDFARCAGFGAVEHIIEYGRIVAPDIFGADFYGGFFGHNIGHLPNDAACSFKAGPLLCINLHAEIAGIGIGKQAESKDRHQSKGG